MILAENKTGIQLLEYLNIPEHNIDYYKPLSSAYAIIQVGGNVLIGFNKWRNQWEFPAGKLDAGETARDAAVRELAEETHQVVQNLAFKGLFRIYDKIQKERRYKSVFTGRLDVLAEFKQAEKDEMKEIILWNMKDDIGYVDEVDFKIVNMI
ncbi:MAG: NUDIX hydrolase, partial [Anaerolineae bacterium]|nr:NUDIX hydrolase [Anaerolineae bacterium]